MFDLYLLDLREKKAIESFGVHIVAGIFIGKNEVGDDAALFNGLDLPI